MEDARQQAEELLEQERQHIRQEAEAEQELARADGLPAGLRRGTAAGPGGGRGPDRRASETGGRAYPQLSGAGGGSAGFAAVSRPRTNCVSCSLAVAEKVIHISLADSRDVIARDDPGGDRKAEAPGVGAYLCGGYEARGSGPDHPRAYHSAGRALRAYQDHPYVRR